MPAVDLSPQTIQALADAVSGSSGSFSSSRGPVDGGGTTESDRQARADNIRYANATKDLRSASKAFTKISKQQDKTADQIKKQVELNSHFVNSAIDGMSNLDINSKAFEGLEELFKSEEQLKIAIQMKEALDNLQDGTVFDSQQYQELSERLDDAGTSFEDLGVVVRTDIHDGKLRAKIVGGLTVNEEGLSRETEKLSKQLKKDTDSLARHTKAVDSMKTALTGAAAGIGVVIKMGIDETRMAMRTGTGDAMFEGFNSSVYRLQITTGEYQEILAKTRSIQHAVNQSGSNFARELEINADALTDSNFAGSTLEAAQATAAMITNMSKIGVKYSELEKPLEKQRKLYEKNFRGMAMSLEQFNQLTEDMVSDVDIRMDLARLSKNERQAYIESLQQRIAENVQMGYSIERAKELNKHFAKISGMNPLQRMQEAAKTRAALGMLGMGAEGERLQKLTNQLTTLKGEDKVAAEKEITEIMTKAANKLQEIRGSDQARGDTYAMALDKMGLTDKFDKFITTADSGIAFDIKAAERQQKAANEANEAAAKGVWLADQARAGLLSSETAALFMAGSWIMSKGMEHTMKALLGATVAAGGPAAIAAVGGAAAAAALIASSAFAVGEMGLDLATGGTGKNFISEAVRENAPEVYDAIGGTLSELLGDEASLTGQQLKELRESNKLKKEEMALHAKAAAAAEERRERQHQEIQQRQKALTDKWTVGALVDKLPIASNTGG